jgi:small subunit ribosomal protein S2
MASSLATTSRCTLGSLTRQSLYRSITSGPVPKAEAVAITPDEDGPTPFDSARRQKALRSASLEHLGELGSTQTKKTAFRPHKPRLDPVTARELTVSHLLASTAHVGHSVSSLSRANIPMLYGTRHGQAIIDVEKYTLPALKKACKIVRDIVYRDGVVIFLGTTPGTERCILQAAKRLGPNGYHITKERWIPGVLTNAPTLLSLAILGDMDKYQEQCWEKRGQRDEPVAATLATQDLQPDLLIVLNPKDNVFAIREATAVGVPTIGVTDTDVDPRIVTYSIPANDESIRTTELIAGVLSKAGEEGAKERRLQLEELDKKRRSLYQAARKRV